MPVLLLFLLPKQIRARLTFRLLNQLPLWMKLRNRLRSGRLRSRLRVGVPVRGIYHGVTTIDSSSYSCAGVRRGAFRKPLSCLILLFVFSERLIWCWVLEYFSL